jgi:hypothetical protein
MTRKARWGWFAACAAAALLGIAGCNHDTLTSGTAGMRVDYVPSPSGAGRYDRAGLAISGLAFLPTDPDRASVYGDAPLIFSTNLDADLTSSNTVSLGRIALLPGTYKITAMTVVTPSLFDSDPPIPALTCIENFLNVPSGPAFGQVPFQYVFSETDGFQFTVRPGQTELQVRVDVPALIAGFEGAFTCDNSCGGPCLSSFDPDAFRSVLESTITFE